MMENYLKIVFDVLKSDSYEDRFNSHLYKNSSTVVTDYGQFYTPQNYTPSSLSVKLIQEASSPIFSRNTLTDENILGSEEPFNSIKNLNEERDLILELDDKLHISTIAEKNLDIAILPDKIIDISLEVNESNTNDSPLTTPLLGSEKFSNSKRCSIEFTGITFDPNNDSSNLNVTDDVQLPGQFDSKENRVFICKICYQTFDNDENYRHHIHEDYKYKKMQQPQYDESLYPQNDLILNSKWKSSFYPVPSPKCVVLRNVSTYSCKIDFCGADFFKNDELLTHMENKHNLKSSHDENILAPTISMQSNRPNGKDINSLKISNMTDTSLSYVGNTKKIIQPSKAKLRSMQPLLANVKERTIKCGRFDCSMKFSSVENREKHLSFHDFSNYSAHSFFCNYCKKNFKSWPDFSLHLWDSHGQDIDLLQCGICKIFKTNSPSKMVLHQEIHFDKQFVCEHCSKSFRQSAQLKGHKVKCDKIPKEEQPLWAQETLCNLCNKWFPSYYSYINHFKQLHLKLKRFSCSVCDYRCYSKSQFTTHLRKHTKVKPYTCELCGLSVSDHNSIRRHRFTHIPKWKLECPLNYCSFRTVNSTAFKKHLFVHHPNKVLRLACQLCSFVTAEVDEYRNHRNSHGKEILQSLIEKAKLKITNSDEVVEHIVTDRSEVYNQHGDDCHNAHFGNSFVNDDFCKLNIKLFKRDFVTSENVDSFVNANSANISSLPKIDKIILEDKLSDGNSLTKNDTRFAKRRKIEENLDFDSVLLIE